MNAPPYNLPTSLGLLILRVGAGGYLMTHGWGKLNMVINGQFEQFGADPIGLGPTLSLILVTGAEFFCAALVVLGVATRFAAAPPVFAMAVAAFVAHASDPWTMSEGARLFMEDEAESWSSKEPALLFLTMFLTLIFTGPGKLSFDAWLWPRLRRAQAKQATANKEAGA